MTKILLFIVIGFFVTDNVKAQQKDIIDGLCVNFKAANFKELGKAFAPTLDLILMEEEDVYSKAQSEQILKDFFLKYPPVKSSVIHKINNNQNYRFGVLLLTTSKGIFRVSITLKKIDKEFLITELRVESSKEE